MWRLVLPKMLRGSENSLLVHGVRHNSFSQGIKQRVIYQLDACIVSIKFENWSSEGAQKSKFRPNGTSDESKFINGSSGWGKSVLAGIVAERAVNDSISRAMIPISR